MLLITTTLGYQAEEFRAAAARLRVPLFVASDRCHRLADPWGDQALPIRFERPRAAAAAIARQPWAREIAGVLALGDRATLAAACTAVRLGLRGNPPAAVRAAADKFRLRRALRAAALPTPAFRRWPLAADPARAAALAAYPCVLKPLALSGSRGVIRADDRAQFLAAWSRIARLLRRPELRAWRAPGLDFLQVESYIAGEEVALEGWLEDGRLRVLALFDKPDPLVGPYFEETIYVTPSRHPPRAQAAIARAIARAAAAVGLRHGPLHAEARFNSQGVFVLELAARPIGGLCARSLRFVPPNGGAPLPFAAWLLRAALAPGAAPRYRREARASGVMMLPIGAGGFLREVAGQDAARAVPHVSDLVITAKLGERLEPLPEGASYLGFVFARASAPALVERSLRQAFARLRPRWSPPLPLAAAHPAPPR
ncbi:MAG TPA: ATP-grasp domain-containing protein [Terriglobales bacterium]|nr:ATP-grasp domain-containing protein [Terriglobales bacterium]